MDEQQRTLCSTTPLGRAPRLAGFALGLFAIVPSARAETMCGISYGQTNIPAGAIGLTVADGPIKAILNGVGETRTHTFIANNTYSNGQWFTQATMFKPRPSGGGAQACTAPISGNDLFSGKPGAEQVLAGALYGLYYDSSSDTCSSHGGQCPGLYNDGSATPVHSGVSGFWYRRGVEVQASAVPPPARDPPRRPFSPPAPTPPEYPVAAPAR